MSPLPPPAPSPGHQKRYGDNGKGKQGKLGIPGRQGAVQWGLGGRVRGAQRPPYQAVLHREVELLLGQPLQLLQEVQVVRGVRLFVCEDFGGLRKSGEG